MNFQWFTDATIGELYQALVDSRLGGAGVQATLSEALDPNFALILPDLGLASIRLLGTLNTLNTTRNLRNGDVPFAQWLRQAVLLSEQRPEAGPIRAAFRSITSSLGQAPVDLPATTADPKFNQQTDEASTGLDTAVDATFLQRGALATLSVARLQVHRYSDSQPQFIDADTPWVVNGTGWLIGPRLLITNYHVINARIQLVNEPDARPTDFELQARNAETRFEYFAEGGAPQIVAGPHELVAADKELDFAILRIGDTDRQPLRIGKQLLIKPVEAPLALRVNVLQHQNGEPMSVGFRDNFVVIGARQFLSYLTDTKTGSSGSPVFDEKWSAIALHRGARELKEILNVRGARIDTENYGTPVVTILDKLLSQAAAIHGEILAAQPAN